MKSRRGVELDDSLKELAELATTAGGEVVGDGVQKLAAPYAARSTPLRAWTEAPADPLVRACRVPMDNELDRDRTFASTATRLALVGLAIRRWQGDAACPQGRADGHAAENQTMRLSEKRVLEAVETGADTLCVVCPYEVSRFEDAVKSTNNDGALQVLDIAELLAQALGLPTD